MYMYVDVHTTEGQATFFFVRLRLFLFHQYSTLPLDAFQQRQTWMGVSRPYSSYRSNTMLCRIGAAADIPIITRMMKYVYKYV